MAPDPQVRLDEARHRFERVVDGHEADDVFERHPGGIA